MIPGGQNLPKSKNYKQIECHEKGYALQIRKRIQINLKQTVLQTIKINCNWKTIEMY